MLKLLLSRINSSTCQDTAVTTIESVVVVMKPLETRLVKDMATKINDDSTSSSNSNNCCNN